MSASSTERIKKECKNFCEYRGITDKKQQRKLLQLAMRSYYNMPSKERQYWSLQEIGKQGL